IVLVGPPLSARPAAAKSGLLRAARLWPLPAARVVRAWSRMRLLFAVTVPDTSGDAALVLLATTVLARVSNPVVPRPNTPMPPPGPAVAMLLAMVLFWITAVPVRVPRYMPPE